MSNWLTWKMSTKNVIFVSTTFLWCLFHLLADPCYNYQNLSDANRKSSYVTPIDEPSLCDKLLLTGWYRFVGDAGTKMPTTRVPAFRCGTDWSGWLHGAHPTVEDDIVHRKVCFSDRSSGCRYYTDIFVKNCESYFIYTLYIPFCPSRFCGTDWMWSKYISFCKRTLKSLRRYVCIWFWYVTYSTLL